MGLLPVACMGADSGNESVPVSGDFLHFFLVRPSAAQSPGTIEQDPGRPRADNLLD